MWMFPNMVLNNKNTNKIRNITMKKCSICKQTIQPDPSGWDGGHNAEPINSGRCCEMCNDMVVIPKRVSQYIVLNIERSSNGKRI